MSSLHIEEYTAVRAPRMHCPYCGDDFILSHGRPVEGFGVICPNVKCGSRIRMNIRLPEHEPASLNGH